MVSETYQHNRRSDQQLAPIAPTAVFPGRELSPGAKYTHITLVATAVRKSLELSTHIWNLHLGEACV